MSKRPGYCYRKLQRPYTQKKYIKRIPQSKVRKFDHGNPAGDFDYQVSLVATSSFQILSKALESARMSVISQLRKRISDREGYFFKIVPYPHHIVRRHAMASVHKAERLQKGMRLAFGKPQERAAQIKRGQTLLLIKVRTEDLEAARYAMKIAKLKLPPFTTVKVEKIERVEEKVVA
ncbi:MAG TPA: 50S ribosomal protein L16 [Candidatus Korarchaeota archaeon]|nr:50S ribosomal protein L16 [Candidatus Korarchaeota archaeon]